MYAIDSAGSVNGQFVAENAQTSTPGTYFDPDWFNMYQDEGLAILAAAQIPPNKADNGQLIEAINKLIGAAVGGASGPPPNQVVGFGMPTRAPLPNGATDCNALVQSGFYVAGDGYANLPTGSFGGILFCGGNTAAANADGAQILVETGNGVAWVRSRINGAWNPWYLLSGSASFANPGYELRPGGTLNQNGLITGNYAEGPVQIVLPYLFDAAPSRFRATVYNPGQSIALDSRIEISAADTGSVTWFVNRGQNADPNIPGFYWEVEGQCAGALHPNPNYAGGQ